MNFKNFPGETWKGVDFSEFTNYLHYAVSNYGRVVSFKETLEQETKLLKGGILGGYPILKTRMKGKDKTFYIHKLVAKAFLEKKTESQIYVLHLDYDKSNNLVNNLKYATKEEYLKHHRKNPIILESRKSIPKPQKGHKLTSTDVLRIKKMIQNPSRKTRMRLIAKQFGISEMQLYRIKSGENWSHVELNN